MNDGAATTVTVRPHETQRKPWKFPPEPPGPVSCLPLHDIVRLDPSTSMYNSDYVKVTFQWLARDEADGTSVSFLILCYRLDPSLSSCLRQIPQLKCVYISCFSYAR